MRGRWPFIPYDDIVFCLIFVGVGRFLTTTCQVISETFLGCNKELYLDHQIYIMIRASLGIAHRLEMRLRWHHRTEILLSLSRMSSIFTLFAVNRNQASHVVFYITKADEPPYYKCPNITTVFRSNRPVNLRMHVVVYITSVKGWNSWWLQICPVIPWKLFAKVNLYSTYYIQFARASHPGNGVSLQNEEKWWLLH
jgi:hypothetical protein